MMKSVLLFFSSVGLTAAVGVAGAAPLQVLRKQLGGLPYWMIGFGTLAILWGMKAPVLAGLFFVNIFLIGALTELRKLKQLNTALTYVATVVITYISFVGVFSALSYFQYFDLLAFVSTQISTSLSLFPELMGAIQVEELYSQLPSLGLIYLMTALFITLASEKAFFKMAEEEAPRRQMLSSFSVPDSMIWVLIASVLGAFGKLGMPEVQMLALNLFNVMLFAFFFQGLAVVTRYFQVFKVGRFWRALFYFIFIFQLFIFTSVLGVVDYWADFRARFKKHAELLSRKNYKSKLGDSK